MRTIVCILMLVAVAGSSSKADEIHKAAADGNVERVLELLAKDPNSISPQNDNWETPLHIAAHRGHLPVVKLLLEKGADVNSRAYNEFTPLRLADDPKIVEEILRYKPDLKARDSALCQTPLEHAADRFTWLSQFPELKEQAGKWKKIVTLLLDAGAYYDIHSAIYLNDIDRVRLLLKADKTLVKNRHGAQMLPLRLAAREGRTEICKMLLDDKADPDDIEEGCGYPVLQAGIKHPAVVKLLIKAGATADVRVTWRGIRTGIWIIGDDATLLHFAAQEGVVESARLLLNKGVKVDAVDNKGQTPLHVAAMLGRADMVRLLLAWGADVNAKNKRGKTPRAFADSIGSSKGAAEAMRQQADKK
jgi:ankyrin-2